MQFQYEYSPLSTPTETDSILILSPLNNWSKRKWCRKVNIHLWNIADRLQSIPLWKTQLSSHQPVIFRFIQESYYCLLIQACWHSKKTFKPCWSLFRFPPNNNNLTYFHDRVILLDYVLRSSSARIMKSTSPFPSGARVKTKHQIIPRRC